MRDNKQTNEQTVKIELLSQWKLEAEFRNYALQDLEEMKASAKPAWECVCPSREEEEEE